VQVFFRLNYVKMPQTGMTLITINTISYRKQIIPLAVIVFPAEVKGGDK